MCRQGQSSCAGLVSATPVRLFVKRWFRRAGGRASAMESLRHEAVDGMGTVEMGQVHTHTSDRVYHNGVRDMGGSHRRRDLPSTLASDDVDEILLSHNERGRGRSRMPISYDIQVRHAAREREARERATQREHESMFDRLNMPRHPHDAHRKRAEWEFTPTAEHKSLILTLYRQLLKGLMHFKSIRKRSMITYTRICFRRRAQATEKLLIDECVEECRRAIYIMQKHHNFTLQRTYEFDSMSLPKDTGQNVKEYMENVYDPEVSRMQLQHFADVKPGREDEHKQGLGPTSSSHHWRDGPKSTDMRPQIRDEDKVFRPPPPPDTSPLSGTSSTH